MKINGLKISNQDQLEEGVCKAIADAEISLGPRDFDRIHYQGPSVKGQPRSILVRFHYFKDKKIVMANKDRFKAKNIHISDDLPLEIQQRRRVIMPIFFNALKVCPNLNPRLRVDTLILGGKEYGVHNISSVPVKQLHPHSVFTPEGDGVTAFFSKQSPLSNHYPCKFKENEIQFNSVEQCVMYKKAMKFKDITTAQQVLVTEAPEKIKVMGRRVHGFNPQAWKDVASDYMYSAMYAKFSQNPELRAFLTQTDKTVLVEASPTDRFWGAGIPLQNADIFESTKWKGKNLAGKVLMRVRQSLQ